LGDMSQLAQLVVTSATDRRDMISHRQLTVQSYTQITNN